MSSGNDNDLFKSAEDAQRLAAAANAMMTDYSCTHWAQLAGGALSPKHLIIQTSSILHIYFFKL